MHVPSPAQWSAAPANRRSFLTGVGLSAAAVAIGSRADVAVTAVSGSQDLAQTTPIATYEFGEFLEGVTVDRRNNVYVTRSTVGRLDRIAPSGRRNTILSLPPAGYDPRRGPILENGGAFLSTLVLGCDRQIYMTVLSNEGAYNGIWRVDPRSRAAELWVPFPTTVAANGITADPFGNLYVAASDLATRSRGIWRVAAGSREVGAWATGGIFNRAVVNGIKWFGGAVRVAGPVTGDGPGASSTMLDVPVRPDGSPGDVEELPVAIVPPPDDFAFDLFGNLYLTTHPGDTLIKLRPDGVQTVIGTRETGFYGPTDIAFGFGPKATTAFVTTDGGIFGQAQSGSPTDLPRVLAVRIGAPGFPVGG